MFAKTVMLVLSSPTRPRLTLLSAPTAVLERGLLRHLPRARCVFLELTRALFVQDRLRCALTVLLERTRMLLGRTM